MIPEPTFLAVTFSEKYPWNILLLTILHNRLDIIKLSFIWIDSIDK